MGQPSPVAANDNTPSAVRNAAGVSLQAFLDRNVPPRLWRRVVDHFEVCAGQEGCAFSMQAVGAWREMKGLTPRRKGRRGTGAIPSSPSRSRDRPEPGASAAKGGAGELRAGPPGARPQCRWPDPPDPKMVGSRSGA